MSRIVTWALWLAAATSGCGPGEPALDGGLDAPLADAPDVPDDMDGGPRDGGVDAPTDGAIDGGADAPTDGATDGGLDAADDAGDASLDGGLDAPSSFCLRLAEALCAAREACGGPAAPDCAAIEGAACLDGLSAALVDGAFDPLRGEACIAAARADYGRCEAPGERASAECRAVVASHAALGAPCSGTSSCADGSGLCDGDTCQVLPASGDGCSSLCALPAVCVAGECGEPAAAGAPCARSEDCAEGTACAGSRCVAPSPTGGPCDPTQPCDAGLRCRRGACEPTAAACASDLECAHGQTCVGDAGDTCHDAALACGPSAPCARGEYCRGTECAPAAAVGESCEDRPCVPEAWCDTSTDPATCVAFRLDGETCGPGDRCEGLTFCNAGQCYIAGPPDCTIPSHRCPDDEYCSGPDFESQRCHAYLPVGTSPCSQFPEDGMLCEAGAHCEYFPSEGAQRCVPDRTAGEACWEEYCFGSGCLFPTCATDAWCDDAHACRAAAGPAEACGSVPCGPALVCAPGVVGGRCGIELALPSLP